MTAPAPPSWFRGLALPLLAMLSFLGLAWNGVNLWLCRVPWVKTLTKKGHTAPAFSPDSDRAVTVSRRQAIVWNVETGESLAVLEGFSLPADSVTFSPDGKRILVVDSSEASFFDAASGQRLHRFREGSHLAQSAVFSRDGGRVAVQSNDATVRIWDTRSGHCLAIVTDKKQYISATAFSPDGERVVAAMHWAKPAVTWDARDGSRLRVLEGHSSRIRCLAYSPDGRRIAAGSDDCTGWVWDAESGRCLATLKGHEGTVLSVAFSPDGRRILTGSYDRTARLWDAETGKCLAVLRGHHPKVEHATFSLDGRRILTASGVAAGFRCEIGDRFLQVWDAATGEHLITLAEHGDIIKYAVFSPDGRRIATAATDDTVHVWLRQRPERWWQWPRLWLTVALGLVLLSILAGLRHKVAARDTTESSA